MPYTLRLPKGNRTTDKEICVLSTLEQRIVITKDADFTQSHPLKGESKSLLYISTGNISNVALIELFRKNREPLLEALKENPWIELTKDRIILHK
jgi:predicted nuclease of predicted toxin-antitoxin system